MTTPSVSDADIEYPDSDGWPMSDNTLQFQWIVTLQGNLDDMFRHDPNVFVAGDLLWYPVQGHPEIRIGPGALVVFGRPRGYRGFYRQWREGGIPPQVVFEVLSPNNTRQEMNDKLAFYEHYGVEEYYLYDPEGIRLSGWRRQDQQLEPIPEVNGWVSPRLGIRFDMSGPELAIVRPDGQRFLTFLEGMERREQAERQAAEAQGKVAQERAAREEAERRAAQLADKLRSLGINPDE